MASTTDELFQDLIDRYYPDGRLPEPKPLSDLSMLRKSPAAGEAATVSEPSPSPSPSPGQAEFDRAWAREIVERRYVPSRKP